MGTPKKSDKNKSTANKAGAIAFSRTGDPDLGDFADAVVLFRDGEVLEDALVG